MIYLNHLHNYIVNTENAPQGYTFNSSERFGNLLISPLKWMVKEWGKHPECCKKVILVIVGLVAAPFGLIGALFKKIGACWNEKNTLQNPINSPQISFINSKNEENSSPLEKPNFDHFLASIDQALENSPPQNAFEWIYKESMRVIPLLDTNSLDHIEKIWSSEKSVLPYLVAPEDLKESGLQSGINLILSEVYADRNKYVFLNPDGTHTTTLENKIAYTPTALDSEHMSSEGVYSYVHDLLASELQNNPASRPRKILIPLQVSDARLNHLIFALVELYPEDPKRADVTVVNTHGNSLDWFVAHEQAALHAAKEVYSSPDSRFVRNTHCCYSNAYSCVADALLISKKLLDNCPNVHDAIKNDILNTWQWTLPNNYRYQLGALTQTFMNRYRKMGSE